MEVRRWSRSDLKELVADSVICMRDELGRDIPVPGWLADEADGLHEADSSGSVEAVHGPDRNKVVGIFGAAVDRPGLVYETAARSIREGVWRNVTVSVVNLVQQADIGGVLFVINEHEGEVDLGDLDEEVGEHTDTHWMILTLDEFARIITVQGLSEDLIGYAAADMVGQRVGDFVVPDGLGDAVAMWLKLIEAPSTTQTSRRQWVRADGSTIWIETSYVNREEHPEGEGPILAVAWDITARRAAEDEIRSGRDALRAVVEDFRSLADEVPSPVFRCDCQGLVDLHNSQWQRLVESSSGYEPDTDEIRIQDLLNDESAAALEEAFEELVERDVHERRSIDVVGADGLRVWRLHLTRTTATRPGGTQFIGSLTDLTDTVRLMEQATTDSLTGLANRASIKLAIDDALLSGEPLTLAFLDLNNFKAVNDTFGHAAGDDVLRTVAGRLARAVRADDTLGRWGGDEFVVVLPSLSETEAAGLAGRLQAALGEAIKIGTETWDPSISVGIVHALVGEDHDSLLHRADQAMYEHKRARAEAAAEIDGV